MTRLLDNYCSTPDIMIHEEVVLVTDHRRGPFKIPEANEFVRECLRAAQNMYQSSVVLVLDKAPCHRNFEAVFAEEEFRNHRSSCAEVHSRRLKLERYAYVNNRFSCYRLFQLQSF
ncbi:hypothetical protein C0J52_20387 [Blattella germanica]|nr:hypothetical protein C0J52_20387 [Blattella germanica]